MRYNDNNYPPLEDVVAIGEWNPEGSKRSGVGIDIELLQKIVDRVAELGLDNIAKLLDRKERSSGAVLMTLAPSAWDCVSDWDDQQLEALIRFFTLAEEELPGWQGAEKSPVIPRNRLVRAAC